LTIAKPGRRLERSRQAILDATRELRADGVGALAVETVAADSRVTKATIYMHRARQVGACGGLRVSMRRPTMAVAWRVARPATGEATLGSSNYSQPTPPIRPLSIADRAALRDFPNRVSEESAFARFHAGLTMLTDKTLDMLLDLKVGQHEAVIAEDEQGIAGVARYARDQAGSTTAEVAILIADEWQHRGVAKALMHALMTAARLAGILQFRARILPDNRPARRFFMSLAPTTRERFVDGDAVVTIPLDDALQA
jgi:RimJ/RimL family protein N-acetyltransferase